MEGHKIILKSEILQIFWVMLKKYFGTFLDVQWWRLCASTVGAQVWFLVGSEIPHVVWSKKLLLQQQNIPNRGKAVPKRVRHNKVERVCSGTYHGNARYSLFCYKKKVLTKNQGVACIAKEFNFFPKNVLALALGFWEVISEPLECHTDGSVFVWMGALSHANMI